MRQERIDTEQQQTVLSQQANINSAKPQAPGPGSPHCPSSSAQKDLEPRKGRALLWCSHHKVRGVKQRMPTPPALRTRLVSCRNMQELRGKWPHMIPCAQNPHHGSFQREKPVSPLWKSRNASLKFMWRTTYSLTFCRRKKYDFNLFQVQHLSPCDSLQTD